MIAGNRRLWLVNCLNFYKNLYFLLPPFTISYFNEKSPEPTSNP